MLKFLKLPSPKEAGKSDTDCLPLAAFNETNSYTWEQYDKDMKKEYPKLYWLNKTLPAYFQDIHFYFCKIYDYIKFNFIPKYRYHILDLRQSSDCECDNYRYGYSDTRERMLYAVFNLISEFVEKEVHPIDNKINLLYKQLSNLPDNEPSKWEKESIQFWINYYSDVRKIYQWWKYHRKFKYSQTLALYNVYVETRSDSDKNLWLKSEEEFDKEEQEMFMKACSLREGLWS